MVRLVGVTNLVSVTEQCAADYGGLLASKDINTNLVHIITNYVYSITDHMHIMSNSEPFVLLPMSYLSPEYIITSIMRETNYMCTDLPIRSHYFVDKIYVMSF